MVTKLLFGEKKKAIRSAGLRTEKKFFGPRGVFVKAGHTQHLKNPKSFHNIEKSGFHRGQYVGYGGGTWRIHKYGTGERSWIAVKQGGGGEFYASDFADLSAKLDKLASQKNPGRPHGKFTSCVEQVSRKRPRVTDPSAVCGAALRKNEEQGRYSSFTWAQIVKYLEQEGWKPLGKKGVAAFSRTIGNLFQVLQLEARAWRVLYRTPLTGATLSLGTYKQLDSAMIAANRQASDWMGKKNPITHKTALRYAKEIVKHERAGMRENPITVIGNPPDEVRANVAGVMYNRVHEVQAEKTGAHKHKGFWYHPFKGKSDVQMLALDSGDILLHSKAGKKLWKVD